MSIAPDQLPAKPRVTIAFREAAYEESEIAAASEFLGDSSDFETEPMSLNLMGGVSEVLITVAFAEPLIAETGISPPVAQALLDVCTALTDWYAGLARNRPCPPELLAVRVAGRDIRVDFSSDLSPEGCLEAREVRSIPRVMRQIGGRLAALLSEHAARIVAIGLHCDPGTGGGGHCVVGRYWEICESEDEPTMIVDSWRERVYLRR